MNLPIRILLYIPSNKHDFHDLRIERLIMVRDNFYTRSTHLVYNRDCVCPRPFHLSSSTPQDIDHYISSIDCFQTHGHNTPRLMMFPKDNLSPLKYCSKNHWLLKWSWIRYIKYSSLHSYCYLLLLLTYLATLFVPTIRTVSWTNLWTLIDKIVILKSKLVLRKYPTTWYWSIFI